MILKKAGLNLKIFSGHNNEGNKMNIKKFFMILLIPVLIISLSEISHAATYYVSQAGSAKWPGCTNINTPCSGKTAMENAIAGDIVYFRGGKYNPIEDPVQQWLNAQQVDKEYIPVWNPQHSGVEGKPITFKAYVGEIPEILDAPYSAIIGAYRRDYIVYDGFKAMLIDEDPFNKNTHLVSMLVRFEESLHSVIRNCDFAGTKFGRHTNNALITIQRSHYMLIENNKLHDNNSLQNTDSGFKELAINTSGVINFYSSNIIIRNNDIYNNYIGIWDKGAEQNNQYYNNHIWGGNSYYASCKQGIYIRVSLGEQGDGTGIKAYQNIINNCGVGIYVESGHDPNPPNAYPLLFNNTIIGNDDYYNNTGISIATHARNAEIFNNIIVGYPVQVRYYTGALIIVSYSNYNNFYSKTKNKRWAINWTANYKNIDLWRSATNFDMNSIEANPQFVNPGGVKPEDYRLQPKSPAKGKGRYGKDMGAYPTGNEIIGHRPR